MQVQSKQSTILWLESKLKNKKGRNYTFFVVSHVKDF